MSPTAMKQIGHLYAITPISTFIFVSDVPILSQVTMAYKAQRTHAIKAFDSLYTLDLYR